MHFGKEKQISHLLIVRSLKIRMLLQNTDDASNLYLCNDIAQHGLRLNEIIAEGGAWKRNI